MVKRYKRPKGVLLMPQDDGDYVLYTDHAAEMREVLEKMNAVLDCISETRGKNAYHAVNEARTVLNEYGHYLKGE